MDNRIIPKWNITLAKKSKTRKYKLISTEDYEKYQRIIAHYDDELRRYKDLIAKIRIDAECSDWPFNEYIRNTIDTFNITNKEYQEEIKDEHK